MLIDKMKNVLFLIVLLSILSVFTGCSKDDETPAQKADKPLKDIFEKLDENCPTDMFCIHNAICTVSTVDVPEGYHGGVREQQIPKGEPFDGDCWYQLGATITSDIPFTEKNIQQIHDYLQKRVDKALGYQDVFTPTIEYQIVKVVDSKTVVLFLKVAGHP